MNKRVLFIVLLIFSSIFFHNYNKYMTLKYSRKIDKLNENIKSLKNINRILVNEHNDLSSDSQIEKKAIEELSMFFPKNNKHKHNIRFNKKDKSFYLIDYIVPSAEALTK